MTFFKSFIDKFHYLSFDVAIGTLIQALAIQKFTQFSFSFDYFILLTLTTLIIYWLDRLLDVYKLNKNLIFTPKHQFYFTYWYLIFGLSIIIGLIISLKGLLFSDKTIQKLGFYGGLLVGLYFFINHVFKGNPKLIFFKELMISIIYSLILWILPLIHDFSLVNIIGFFCLFSHALLNLWIISLWDKELDIVMKTHSFAQFIFIEQFINLLLVITFIFCTILTYLDYSYGFVNFLMFIGHAILFRTPKHALHRIFMEFIFWIPLIYLLFF